jgi:lycopene cyclase domain-containing protein
MKYTYLLVDFFTVLIPFIFSYHPKIKFKKHFSSFFIANSIIAFLFIIWDIYFTSLGIWSFNSNYVIGINLFNLPIEEVLFFICIPFSCLFTFHCLGLFYKLSLKPNTENFIVLVFSSIILIFGIYFIDRIYTSTTFISLSIVLISLKYLLKVKWIGQLLIIYPVLLIPFFIVNGILTGSWINEPIVLYNNSETIGLRVLTIPLEDIFYGFGLISLNILLFELIKVKKFSNDIRHFVI